MDRRADVGCGALDRPLRLETSNPAKNLVNLSPPDLPVRHLHCLLGAELALLLPPMMWLSRRRSRRG